MANLNGKNAVHIICSLEYEEKDELLLALSRAFLSQQLRRGDMYYLWYVYFYYVMIDWLLSVEESKDNFNSANSSDLVFVWSELNHRLKTSKQDLLDEIHQLMLSATNVNSIFPFIRAILQEVRQM